MEIKLKDTSNKSIMKKISGRIWVLGDNIDTDLIVPSRVLTVNSRKELLGATLESVIPNFSSRVNQGDIIVGGKNFGCGSSREEAVFVLKELGIAAIIAQSFSRIFFRNCINLGLPAIEPMITSTIKPNFSQIGEQGDVIEINFSLGEIINQSHQNEVYKFQPFPPFLKSILESGGIIDHLRING
jgi:3-isopropylmalate/(R)-2-methylmalate dehydratase small subunit